MGQAFCLFCCSKSKSAENVQDFLDKAKKEFEEQWSKNIKVRTVVKNVKLTKTIFLNCTLNMYFYARQGRVDPNLTIWVIPVCFLFPWFPPQFVS